MNAVRLPDLERCSRCGRSLDGSGRHAKGGAILCDADLADDLKQLSLWPVIVASGLAPANKKKRRRR
jgi:recombinational DNA repair protein (RecF pathway)